MATSECYRGSFLDVLRVSAQGIYCMVTDRSGEELDVENGAGFD